MSSAPPTLAMRERAFDTIALPGTLLDAGSMVVLLAQVRRETDASCRTEVLGLHEAFDDEVERIGAIAAGCAMPPVVIGHSLGGIVALELAARHPSRVAGVVAIASNARADHAHGEPRREAQRRWVVDHGLASLVRDRLAVDYALASSDAMVDALVAQAERVGAAAFEQQLDYAAARPGLLSPRRSLAVPVLALSGARDTLCPPRDGDEIAALGIHPSSHDTHPDAGHLLPMQQPAWVADRIVAFLRAIGASAHATSTKGRLSCAPIA